MATRVRTYNVGGKDLALGTIFNEIQRIMFNLDIRRQRLNEFARNAEENGVHIKRRIRNLIELGQYAQAKTDTRDLVETNYNHMSITVVAKKIAAILAILRDKLKKPGIVDSYFITYLKKADKAVRGNDLKDMDVRLTKLKRFLQPEIVEEDIDDIKVYLESAKEAEINKIYGEIYDEVNLVQSLAGLSAKPVIEAVQRKPLVQRRIKPKEKPKEKIPSPHYFEFR